MRTCRARRVLGSCTSHRQGWIDVQLGSPSFGDEGVPVEQERRVDVPTHVERALEGRRKTKRDLHRVGIDERCQSAGRISAVRRGERTPEAAWKADLHAPGL